MRGSLRTWLFPEDLRQWQQALDMLDAGQDIEAYDRLDLIWKTWRLNED
ncbi:DUF5959 family protein [Streptomyces sp. Ag109_G2-15]|nr:DUF5959 family protein [Streptomyces sp. Ag109_G2-15]